MCSVIELHGMGLHSGAPCSVVLRRQPGPLRFDGRHGAARLDELTVTRTDQGVCVESEPAAIRVDLCEHLLAAFGGLSVRDGITIRVVGGEVPLLGGGAAELADALRSLEAPAGLPSLVVARAAAFEEGSTRYELRPGAGVSLHVRVDFPAIGEQTAAWDGTPSAFVESIAPARTFGFLRDGAELRRRRRARHVDPDAVLVFDDHGTAVGSTRPMEPEELARHKLLDLIGDFTLYGGPPEGSVRAERPGHAATHRVVHRALASGVLVRRHDATLLRA